MEDPTMAVGGAPMFLIGIFLSLGLGALIGLRFRVHVLVFAMVAAATIVGAEGLAANRYALVIFGELIGLGVALQGGYLLGVLLRVHLRLAPTTIDVGHAGALAPGFSDIPPD